MSMATAEHRQVIHRCTGISCEPFGVGKASVKTLECWLGGETLVGPGICRVAVPKIDETTLLDMITKKH
jgi:hypothetical protein